VVLVAGGQRVRVRVVDERVIAVTPRKLLERDRSRDWDNSDWEGLKSVEALIRILKAEN